MILQDRVTQLYYREGTYDVQIFREIKRCYGLLDVRGKVVLDIGANIGGFTDYALKAGARRVVGYEPSRENFDLLKRNITDNRATLHNCAVTNKKVRRVTFYKSMGVNYGIGSTEPHRGRDTYEVAAENFYAILGKLRPQVIKIDVEGAEYDILSNLTTQPLGAYVKQIAMEIHLNRRTWRNDLGPALIKKFNAWRAVKQPHIGASNWTTIGVWRR